MISRRELIRIGAASVGSLALRPFGLLPALAQGGGDYKALVCIFLFGGNDSNNSIIPMDDASYKLYMASRGNLALTTGASNLGPTVTSATGNPYAFHSGLTELSSMFSSKELAVVANVGSLVQPLTRAQYQARASLPNNLFSHSDQQLQWQSSVAQGNSSTGWAGRTADYVATQGLNGSTFPTFFSVAGNSLMGSGVNTTPVAVSPGGTLQITGSNITTPEGNARTHAVSNVLNTDTGLSLIQAADHVLLNGLNDANKLTMALAGAPTLSTAFPNTGLGAQLKQVAQIISVHASLNMSRQIFFCSMGGFDTHTDELNQHKNLYPQLSQAIAAFYTATDKDLHLAQNVTTFTESDFSRTFQPTTGNGSDHAWGSHQIVVGGAVQGGRVFGRFPNFTLGGPDDTDTRGRWIPTTSIDQYGATLCKWFGIPLDTMFNTIFPNLGNFDSANIGFLG